MPWWLFQPLHGDGYQFWSGIGSGSPILAALLVFLHRHNCHEHRCWRPAWHPHPASGHPVCKHHHPDHPSGDHPAEPPIGGMTEA